MLQFNFWEEISFYHLILPPCFPSISFVQNRLSENRLPNFYSVSGYALVSVSAGYGHLAPLRVYFIFISILLLFPIS